MKTIRITKPRSGIFTLGLYLMLAAFPWACADHRVDPPVTVTCSCNLLDNSGVIGVQTRTLDCPGGRYTCICGDLAFRGGIREFHCD